MAISLTPRQSDALRFIQGHLESKGYGPRYEDIRVGLRLANRGRAHAIVMSLEDRGAIRRLRRRTRAIEVLRPLPIPRAPDGAPLHFVRIEGADA